MNNPVPMKQNSDGHFSIEEVNAMDRDAFVSAFGSIFEDSPWVAFAAWDSLPFASADALLAAMCAAVKHADHEKQLALLCAHPELGLKKKLTPASQKEQQAAGLTDMEAEESRRHIARLNQHYRRRFGFPFILAVKGHGIASIIDSMEKRLGSQKNTEFAACLAEVYKIARFRLQDILV